MGRTASAEMKKRRAKEKDDTVDDDEEEEVEEEAEAADPKNPVVEVELGDSQAIKTALDDSLCQVVAEMGYPEDLKLSDVKIALGLLASAFGLFGQFHEFLGFAKFPNDRHILGACVLGYMVCSSLLSVVAVLWEKNYICCFQGAIDRDEVWPPLEENEPLPTWSTRIQGIKVETRLQTYETDFTVCYSIQTSDDGEWHEPYEQTEQITKWFNMEGALLEAEFQAWAKGALVDAAVAATTTKLGGKPAGKKA